MTDFPAARQLGAIGARHYYVVIRQHRRDGTDIVLPHIGPLTAMEIIDRIPEWRRRNAARADVYVRVADDPPPCVLIDDLFEDSLRRLLSDMPVRAAVQTSPLNWQAWVPVPDGVDALAWSRALARRYDGDPGAVQARQPGRLVGLANRKPRHARSDGRGPWVMMNQCDPTAAPVEAGRVTEIMGHAPPPPPPPPPESKADGVLRAVRRPPCGRNGRPERSPSEDDWALARRMVARGAPIGQIEAAVLASALARDKRGAEQYARRTARKAAGLPV